MDKKIINYDDERKQTKILEENYEKTAVSANDIYLGADGNAYPTQEAKDEADKRYYMRLKAKIEEELRPKSDEDNLRKHK